MFDRTFSFIQKVDYIMKHAALKEHTKKNKNKNKTKVKTKGAQKERKEINKLKIQELLRYLLVIAAFSG